MVDNQNIITKTNGFLFIEILIVIIWVRFEFDFK